MAYSDRHRLTLWPSALACLSLMVHYVLQTSTKFQVCIALIFTARCICIAPTIPWQDGCLSVHTSVCHMSVFCLNGHKYPQSYFTVGSPTILVFPHQTGWQYSDGDPPNRGIEYKGVWKTNDFRPTSRFISEMMQDRALVKLHGRQIGNSTHTFKSYQSEWLWVTSNPVFKLTLTLNIS